ncbi:MAG: hypothetical protein IPH72_27220 [Sandaracinaceae bacterium]|nr:hypothetical protein [Sandaracinaceae bacterium]
MVNLFERVVPRGTIYAVASARTTSCDAWRCWPRAGHAQRMYTAYSTMSQEARDEEQGETMDATSSGGVLTTTRWRRASWPPR